MTLMWMDSFDQYGSVSNLTGYGVWAEVQSSLLSTSIKRTGTTSLQIFNARRVFPGSFSTVGIGFAFYLTALPGSETLVFKINGASGNGQMFLAITATGAISLWAGENTTGASAGTKIYTTPTPVVVTGAWQHLEIKFVPNGASSTAEVRLNMATIINQTFQEGSSLYGETSSTVSSGAQFKSVYIDDLFAWNSLGSFNNDFIGDRRVYTLFPDADTATADWLKNSGSVGYDRINEVPPDGDTSYIYTSTVDAVSAFDMTAMPSDAGAINAVQTYRGTRKTDSGTCDVRTEIISGVSTAVGASSPATTAYQYYQDVFETDPATGALWTKTAVNAAKVKVKRTA